MAKIEKEVKAIKFGNRGLGINLPKIIREILNINEKSKFKVILNTDHLAKNKEITLILLEKEE